MTARGKVVVPESVAMRCIDATVPSRGRRRVPKLIYRNVGWAVAGNCALGPPPGGRSPGSTGERTK
jgi:hypothetical protein